MSLKIKTVKGRGYWVARFTRDGRTTERSLGSVEALTKTAARRKHDALAVALDAGELKAGRKQTSPAFKDGWPEMYAALANLRKWKNARSGAAWTRSFSLYATPAFGHKPVDTITREDVLALLRPLWETKTETASRMRMHLETFFNWAKAKGWAKENPAQWKGGLEFDLPPRARVKAVKHHEAPTIAELRQAVAYCRAHPSPVSAQILFTVATVARVSEVRFATAEEIEGNNWVMPAQRRKDGQAFPHRVPLSSLAFEALAMARPEGLLFTANGRRPTALDTPRLKLCAIIGRRVTMHGVRSTFRDWAAVEGIDFVAAEKALSHKVGTNVTQAYLREDMLEARRPIMERWAAVLTETHRP